MAIWTVRTRNDKVVITFGDQCFCTQDVDDLVDCLTGDWCAVNPVKMEHPDLAESLTQAEIRVRRLNVERAKVRVDFKQHVADLHRQADRMDRLLRFAVPGILMITCGLLLMIGAWTMAASMFFFGLIGWRIGETMSR